MKPYPTKKIKIIFLAATLLFSFGLAKSSSASSRIYTCTGTNDATAINNIGLTAGDVLTINPGTCNFETSVDITGFSILGSGIGSTIINGSASAPAFGMSPVNNTDLNELGQMTINGTAAHTVRIANWNTTVTLKKIRIHHIRFVANGGTDIDFEGVLGGLVDHCIFDGNPAIGVRAYGFAPTVEYPYTTILAGETSWKQPVNLNPSQDDKIYFEDNTVNMGSTLAAWIDTQYGARIVARKNTMANGQFHSHGTYMNGRGGQWYEVYNNIITANTSGYNSVNLRSGSLFYFNNSTTGHYQDPYLWINSQRAAGFAGYYWNTGPLFMCDGSQTVDGNNAIAGGTGTVTSADPNGNQLTDSAKSWTSNSMLIDIEFCNNLTGTHAGASSVTTMTTSSGDVWKTGSSGNTTCNTFAGNWIKNVTKNAQCLITSNGDSTQVCSDGLTGGAKWDNSDAYSIGHGMTIWNLTTGAKAQIYANTGNTIKHFPLTGGTRQTWQVGDSYKISDGYPCLDLSGRSYSGSGQGNTASGQTSDYPVLAWGNTGEGYMIASDPANRFQSGRDYLNLTSYGLDANKGTSCASGNYYGTTDPWPANTTKLYKCVSGAWSKIYETYQYPHPLQGAMPPPPPPPAPITYNITNFTQLVSDWLKTISNSPADVNADGTVNAKDLGIMMSKWK